MPGTQRQDDKPAAAPVVDKPVKGDAATSADGGDSGAVAPTAPAPSPQFTTKPGDVTADPRTGKPFGEAKTAGLKGRAGFDIIDEPGNVVQGVDPDAIPAEVTPGVTPDAGGDELLAAAMAKAPSLTKEFVESYGLGKDVLAAIARGEVPPPPTPGPIHTSDLYLTPGGWQQTPPGVPPEDVGVNQVHRT